MYKTYIKNIKNLDIQRNISSKNKLFYNIYIIHYILHTEIFIKIKFFKINFIDIK